MTYSGNQGYFGAGNVVGKDSGMTTPLNMANTGFEFQPTRVELLSSEREEFIMEVGKFICMISICYALMYIHYINMVSSSSITTMVVI